MTNSHEISMPVVQKEKVDPYALPASMPSSADKAVRSFDINDFAVPTAKQDDWRFTPVQRFDKFFHSFKSAHNIEVKVHENEACRHYIAPLSHEPCGSVSKPSDRASAVAWQCTEDAHIFEITQSMQEPYIISITGHKLELEAQHLVINVHDRVHANIIVEHSGQTYLTQGVEIITGQQSDVSVTFVHEWSNDSQHIANHRLRVGKNAILRHAVVTLSADIARIRVDQDFAGEQSEINMLGLYFVDAQQHIEHRTMVVHNYPDCRSRVVYKGALNGTNAHATWVGNALIRAKASGTDSYELNKNLVLTPGAIADSEPNLEIENGDIVGAGHASSVGRFNDEELFYLQSRGVSEEEARKLVVRGFFAELIGQLGIPSIADHVMTVIDRRLANIDVSFMEEK